MPKKSRTADPKNVHETPQKVPRRSARLMENNKNMEKVSNEEANLPPPPEVDVPQHPVPVAKQGNAPIQHQLREERVDLNTVLFKFPSVKTDQLDPVEITPKDIRSLDRDKYLNDKVLQFMINYLISYRIDKKLLSTIHWFSNFFYSKITRDLTYHCFSGRNAIVDAMQTTLVTNCTRVLCWTKKFDVFTKDYIVIPIHEDRHWLLITIFNPSGAIVNVNDEENSRNAPKCYVAFFDPLSGLRPTKRNHMCHCITTYLEQLYINTKAPGTKYGGNQNTIYDPSRVIVTVPKGLPIQGNYFDCGLFVLSYIEGLFCYLNKPITVHDIPNFNWSERYSAATEMAELMRDKVYNTILKVSTPENKTRLSRFEQQQRRGMSLEGHLRKGRRHSADRKRRVPRHEEYRPRRYSVHTRERFLIETPLFMNPRAWAEMPCTIEARSIRWPEKNFVCLF